MNKALELYEPSMDSEKLRYVGPWLLLLAAATLEVHAPDKNATSCLIIIPLHPQPCGPDSQISAIAGTIALTSYRGPSLWAMMAQVTMPEPGPMIMIPCSATIL